MRFTVEPKTAFIIYRQRAYPTVDDELAEASLPYLGQNWKRPDLVIMRFLILGNGISLE